jgi:hypothetical protein
VVGPVGGPPASNLTRSNGSPGGQARPKRRRGRRPRRRRADGRAGHVGSPRGGYWRRPGRGRRSRSGRWRRTSSADSSTVKSAQAHPVEPVRRGRRRAAVREGRRGAPPLARHRWTCCRSMSPRIWPTRSSSTRSTSAGGSAPSPGSRSSPSTCPPAPGGVPEGHQAVRQDASNRHPIVRQPHRTKNLAAFRFAGQDVT